MNYIGFIPGRTSRAGLLDRARMFPLRGPLNSYSAWDGIALAEYACRERLWLRKGWLRQIDKAGEVIKNSGTIAAFKMVAYGTVAHVHLVQLRLILSPDYQPSEADWKKAYDDLTGARRPRRKAA